MAWLRYVLLAALISCPLISASAEISLRLRWDIQANPGLEGKLLVPDASGLYGEKPPLEVKKSEILAEARWTLDNLPPGRIRFYVVNGDRNDEFADWAGYRWLDMVEVVVTQGTRTRRFTAPEGAGAYWYVFDIIGEDGTLLPTMQIMPRSQAVYGHITDAATGLPVRNAEVDIVDRETGSVLGRDRTSASGLYLFFVPDSHYILKVRGRDYISMDEPLLKLGMDFPRRRDFNLSRVLRENQFRVVVSWDYYPENLDLFWSTPGGTPDNLLWEYQGRQPFSSESLLLDNPEGTVPLTGQILVEAPEDEISAYALAYSQARIRLFQGTRVLNFLMPPLRPGRQWKALEFTGGEVRDSKNRD